MFFAAWTSVCRCNTLYSSIITPTVGTIIVVVEVVVEKVVVEIVVVVVVVVVKVVVVVEVAITTISPHSEKSWPSPSKKWWSTSNKRCSQNQSESNPQKLHLVLSYSETKTIEPRHEISNNSTF